MNTSPLQIFTSSPLPQLDLLWSVFAAVDMDESQAISTAEFYAYFGMDQSHYNTRIFELFDIDDSGEVRRRVTSEEDEREKMREEVRLNYDGNTLWYTFSFSTSSISSTPPISSTPSTPSTRPRSTLKSSSVRRGTSAGEARYSQYSSTCLDNMQCLGVP